jgi:hypothetical protein
MSSQAVDGKAALRSAPDVAKMKPCGGSGYIVEHRDLNDFGGYLVKSLPVISAIAIIATHPAAREYAIGNATCAALPFVKRLQEYKHRKCYRHKDADRRHNGSAIRQRAKQDVVLAETSKAVKVKTSFDSQLSGAPVSGRRSLPAPPHATANSFSCASGTLSMNVCIGVLP